MRNSMMLAAFISLSLAACATDDQTPDGTTLPGPTVSKTICPHGCSRDIQSLLDDGQWIPTGDGAFLKAHSNVQGVSACNSLPLTGQCAYACDQQGFVETLPLGTCAAIACKVDSYDVVVGGCHL
jgi:hypothetical protein